MARIFVSYSRKNIDFTKRLTGRLQERELDLWVDWEDIPPTVDWTKEIQKGIEEADTFLFIVSPDSIISKICKEELELAVKNGKRLIPVVPYEIKWDDAPPELSHLNYIFFRETDDFDLALEKLFTAIDTDYVWVQTHRRLQVKALEWERGNKDNGFLLRGRDLEEAEGQISINATKDPRPTDIQREYVLRSRQGATRQRRMTTGILIGLIAGMLGVIALLARPYVEEAIAKAQAQDQSEMITVPTGSINLQLGDTFQTVDVQHFRIESRPVTNRIYGLCVRVDQCTPPVGSTDFNDSSKANDPVVWITIVQAATYCEWVGRRLPTITEWERAVGYFAKSNLDKDRLSLSTHYEWTSSYTVENSQGTIGEWDGKISNLDIVNWIFLQEVGSISPAGDPEIITNSGGAFGANADLSFRCAIK